MSMLPARAEITKGAYFSAYSVMASHPSSAGEVATPFKGMAGLLQLALDMNAGLVSRSRVDLFDEETV